MGSISLNPCCAGYYSLTNAVENASATLTEGLNPCCAGYYSLTQRFNPDTNDYRS